MLGHHIYIYFYNWSQKKESAAGELLLPWTSGGYDALEGEAVQPGTVHNKESRQ